MGRVFLLFFALLGLSGCGGGKFRDSKVIFEGTYYLEDTENMKFVFSEDSTLTVMQEGIYEMTENEEGEPVIRICLDDISREMPEDYGFTEYRMREADDSVALTYTTDAFQLDENPMLLFHLEGEDGLLLGACFDGTYQIGEGGESYQYIFEKDGGITMQVEERYYADKGKLTLTDHAGSTHYLYEASEDTLMIRNRKEELIMTLRKEAESE